MKISAFLAVVALCCLETLAVVRPETSHDHSHRVDVGGPAKKKQSQPHFTFHEMYNMTVNFFDQFSYPNNAVQAKLINSTLFAEDIVGRVDVTRDFDGQELNTEYAFGLFSNIALNPDSFTLLGVPVAYVITHFAASEYVVSVAIIVSFEITQLGVTNPVEIDFWCTFNEDGQIDQYDATFRFMQWQFDSLIEVGEQLLGLNSSAAVITVLQEKLASSICNTAQKYCNGTNLQYESEDACYTHLTEAVPFGEAYQMGFNTVLCRMVHQNMVPLRPDVHCPHLGPTGGGYCTNDRTYAANVLEPLFTNRPFVPEGYHNKNSTLTAE